MSPFALFSDWLAQAQRAPLVTEPTAMCLATATPRGLPSARMVLLKQHDARGFAFYTNLESRKSEEIRANPHGALLFFWDFGTRGRPDQRQVRIEGVLSPTRAEEADAYYASRHPQSRIGAWASAQSRPLESRAALMARFREIEARYGENPPRPPFWSGWRLAPEAFEFWKQGDHRLHERRTFTRAGESWEEGLLNP
jgi:pyridoxamine 5'-phosphate oxidase